MNFQVSRIFNFLTIYCKKVDIFYELYFILYFLFYSFYLIFFNSKLICYLIRGVSKLKQINKLNVYLLLQRSILLFQIRSNYPN